MILLGGGDRFAFGFPIIIGDVVLVGDGVYIDMSWGFNGGSDKVGLMPFGVGVKGTEQFLGLVEGFLDGDGFLSPVDRRVDVLQPRESQDYVLVFQVHDVEGGSTGYSSNIEEQGGGESDYPFGVDRVVCVPGLDRGFQALGRDSLFPDKSPVNAGNACPAINKGSGVNGFHRVRGDNELNWALHSGRRLYKYICTRYGRKNLRWGTLPI